MYTSTITAEAPITNPLLASNDQIFARIAHLDLTAGRKPYAELVERETLLNVLYNRWEDLWAAQDGETPNSTYETQTAAHNEGAAIEIVLDRAGYDYP